MIKPTFYTARYDGKTLRSDEVPRENTAKIGEWYFIPQKCLFERMTQTYDANGRGKFRREQLRGEEPFFIPKRFTAKDVFTGKNALPKPQISLVNIKDNYIVEPEISVKMGEAIANKRRKAERRAQLEAAGLHVPEDLQEFTYLTDHALDKVVNAWLYKNQDVDGGDYAAIAHGLKVLNYRLMNGETISASYIKTKTRRRDRNE